MKHDEKTQPNPPTSGNETQQAEQLKKAQTKTHELCNQLKTHAKHNTPQLAMYIYQLESVLIGAENNYDLRLAESILKTMMKQTPNTKLRTLMTEIVKHIPEELPTPTVESNQ